MKKKITFLLLLLIFSLSTLYAQEIQEIEFRNKEITDILLTLAEMSGRSIIPDETVQGTASYYFRETEFESALKVFLSTYKLYYRTEDSIYYISRIQAAYNEANNTISMDAEDVEIQYLIRAASKAIQKTILYDSLPAARLTIHVEDVAPEKFLEILIKRFPEYIIEADADFYYVKRPRDTSTTTTTTSQGRGLLKKEGDMYSIDTDKVRFSELISDLFARAGFEYSRLSKKDQILEDLHFKDKGFSQMLRLMLEQMNMDYQVVGDIYYIFDITQRDILKKLISIVKVPLVYISTQDFQRLIPSDFASSKLYKFDVNTNSIILSGSLEEIGPIQEFIKTIDRPSQDYKYYRFQLNYIDVKNLKALLPLDFRYFEPIVIPNTNMFLMALSSEQKIILDEYLSVLDSKSQAQYIKLKYIKAEDLLKTLPPSITKEDIAQTGDPCGIFFIGSREKYEVFRKQLELIDRPVPQIRYKLLVISYSDRQDFSWHESMTAEGESPFEEGATESSQKFAGTIGELLSLNFDIVSTFGAQFAVNLNTDLKNNKARVVADTTLNGVSGQEIKFQNTSTYRYRETETNPDTGEETQTGVTSEITSGLIISLNGWVSGNNMITMDVNATVSKRGSDTSTGGNPPITTEKVVNTQVRTEAGRPIIISGLISQNIDESLSKTPVLGDVPLLGYLFQGRDDSVDSEEMAIYIIPHVVFEEDTNSTISRNIERYYYKYLYPLNNSRY